MNTCIALYADGDNITYFDSFGVWKIHKQINIKTNVYRIQENDSIMCQYFCI